MPSLKPLLKEEDPAGYAARANTGLLLGYPVKIGGNAARGDNGIKYHSTIKYFDPERDHAHSVHNVAQHLPLNPPDAKNTQIKFDTFKDRFGKDVHAITLHGNSAEKLKEHNAKFAHMGFPSTFQWTPHISVDRDTFDRVKNSGAKTAHEAGIEFGPAELKRGPKTIKTYHHAPDTTEPRVPDESDFTAKVDVPKTDFSKAENTLGQKPLMKPYVSDAQRRWAHTSSGKEALGGNAGVHEWDEATKGKKLPERVSKSEQSPTPKPNVQLNPEHGKTIANAYEGMKHDPNHPDVKAAYGALIGETGNQFKKLLGSGLKISQIKSGQANPYKSSKEMHQDVKNNKHLWYFPTEQGFGEGDQTPKDHPMLAPTTFKHGDRQLLANDVFRIVHDINGHHIGGESGFGPTGEHQAYLTHKKQYSPLAQKALASETMGQNNWVNFGPHGEQNRANPANTKFAEQKAGLLPDNIINGKWHNEK